MALRCFLFSSDEGTSDVIRQVLTALDVEGETCPSATIAVEKVANEPFQLVIIDWDQQPEAAMVLSAARDRKAADRPLTLAMVSDDPSVPKALQAGANSILRKPLSLNQVTDTLTTARDLIRSRLESAAKPAQTAAAAAATPATLPPSLNAGQEKLRAGEFLQSAPLNPSGQFVTESEISASPDQSVVEPVDQLRDLETVAAPAPPPPPPPVAKPDEPRGLEWYLKKNGIQRGGVAAAPAPAPAAATNSGPELLGYDQTPSYSPSKAVENDAAAPNAPSSQEQKNESPLFSYITGDTGEAPEPEEETREKRKRSSSSPSRFRLGKGTIAALGLAACAVIAAPQAPWHPQIKMLLARGQRSLHAWLNPPATTVVAQAPAAHEDFGRAGDEYKLPVAENIPDATTDPSKIQVVPEVDPTAKKPAGDGSAPDQSTAPTDATPTTPPATSAPTPDGSQAPAVPVQQNPAAQPAPAAALPATTPAPVVSAPASTGTTVAPASNPPAHVDAPALITPTPIPPTPAPSTPPPPKRQPTPYIPVTAPKVPSSLQSQLAVMMPDASGNKPADTAMPSIEPVSVPELSERALITDQPTIPYPASANGQQGTVILQVLIGRDGTIQDAKFLQGSLAFARTAIDGVRQWKFKPYTMNGRPVSVQTLLTIKFKPA